MRKVLILSFVILVLICLTNCSTRPNIEQASATNEKNNLKVYKSVDGWEINYPSSWNKIDQNYIQEESTGKTVIFHTERCSKDELEKWIESEIKRKLEVGNTLSQDLKNEQFENLVVYSYTINSKIESSEWFLKNTIFFDGKMRYEFRTQFPPATEKEYDEIIKSFKIIE